VGREAAAAEAEKIIVVEANGFRRKLMAERVVPTIVALRGRLEPLGGAHDRNFKVTAAGARRYLFKIHPPTPDPRAELQATALHHLELNAPELPLSRLFLGRGGSPLPAVRDAIAQALSIRKWSDGIEVLSAAPDFITVRMRCSLPTADRLAQFMKELPCALNGDERCELSMAFREMLLNAIEHGGKLDPNEWVLVSRVRTRRAIVYHIQDPGNGFSREDLCHAAISNPEDNPAAHLEVRMAENMRPGGFGMLIASQSVDEVIYSQTGNEVILIKHLD